MVSHRELLRRLRTFARAANANVERINWGGCGVVAGIVGQILEDMGVPCEVVTQVAGHHFRPACEVRRRINPKKAADPFEWSSNGLSRWHLALRFISGGRTYTWDTDGLVCSAGRFGTSVTEVRGYIKTERRFGSGMTVAECAAISAKQAGWNTMFDRKSIPMLETLAAYHVRHGL